MDSILNNIKAMLGVQSDDTAFDTEIITYINSVLMTVNQLGLGVSGFLVTGPDETWAQFLETFSNVEAVKTFVYINTRLLFDPPSSSVVTDSLTRMSNEYGWRLATQVDPPVVPTTPEV